ncbi:hypothetical protein FOC75_27765 (plasmid) [Bacillus cereus]|uniref:hypothetical protein n=1 Tax=Bacillus cereus group TaxID=86661 RepID=UPI000539330A|nr:hypothetical protein [Bacillus cereus]AJH60337.1 hypothetical protein BG11_5551 [Bacillus cereus]AJK37350.1 hypothetical protein BF33_5712 [Bacillus cereus]QKH69354.1 hypothetical protein FOC75_27765 [Bacillus cereus]QKH71451.1 hypothetical protein FOC74_00110 [Bacillus cereus]
MNHFSTRQVVAPAIPSVHIAPVHAASSTIGIPFFEQYATPPEYTASIPVTPYHPYYYPTAVYQYHYHFPSIYFQNFYGTFNI